MNELENISKTISYILRHRPEDFGIPMNERGWVNVDLLIQAIREHKDQTFNKSTLDEIVAGDSKNRYRYSNDGLFIRANQGHSMAVNLDLEPQRPPDVLYHGTATRFMDSIMDKGITSQTRQYVHLSHNYDTAMCVGARHGEPYVISINAWQMYNNGIDFFLSENGVWLVDYVPPEYFLES